jgi:hypothetical protein
VGSARGEFYLLVSIGVYVPGEEVLVSEFGRVRCAASQHLFLRAPGGYSPTGKPRCQRDQLLDRGSAEENSTGIKRYPWLEFRGVVNVGR